jgi:hypothetical protein
LDQGSFTASVALNGDTATVEAHAGRADWRVFCDYCQLVDAGPLPATPETGRLFLLACHPLEGPEEGAPPPSRRAPATLHRYLETHGLEVCFCSRKISFDLNETISIPACILRTQTVGERQRSRRD